MKCLPLKERRWHWVRPLAAMPASISTNRLLRLLITRTKWSAGSEGAQEADEISSPHLDTIPLTLELLYHPPDEINERLCRLALKFLYPQIGPHSASPTWKLEQLKISCHRSVVSACCEELLRKAACNSFFVFVELAGCFAPVILVSSEAAYILFFCWNYSTLRREMGCVWELS